MNSSRNLLKDSQEKVSRWILGPIQKRSRRTNPEKAQSASAQPSGPMHPQRCSVYISITKLSLQPLDTSRFEVLTALLVRRLQLKFRSQFLNYIHVLFRSFFSSTATAKRKEIYYFFLIQIDWKILLHNFSFLSWSRPSPQLIEDVSNEGYWGGAPDHHPVDFFSISWRPPASIW